MRSCDPILIPTVFALATGLPVIILSLLLTISISKMGKVMNKVSQVEKVVRIGASLIFIAVGIYYIAKVNLGI